jgi:hypothetical protein
MGLFILIVYSKCPLPKQRLHGMSGVINSRASRCLLNNKLMLVFRL